MGPVGGHQESHRRRWNGSKGMSGRTGGIIYLVRPFGGLSDPHHLLSLRALDVAVQDFPVYKVTHP